MIIRRVPAVFILGIFFTCILFCGFLSNAYAVKTTGSKKMQQPQKLVDKVKAPVSKLRISYTVYFDQDSPYFINHERENNRQADLDKEASFLPNVQAGLYVNGINMKMELPVDDDTGIPYVDEHQGEESAPTFYTVTFSCEIQKEDVKKGIQVCLWKSILGEEWQHSSEDAVTQFILKETSSAWDAVRQTRKKGYDDAGRYQDTVTWGAIKRKQGYKIQFDEDTKLDAYISRMNPRMLPEWFVRMIERDRSNYCPPSNKEALFYVMNNAMRNTVDELNSSEYYDSGYNSVFVPEIRREGLADIYLFSFIFTTNTGRKAIDDAEESEVASTVSADF